MDSVDQAIIDGLRPIIPDTCPQKLRELIQDCWKENPEERPTVDILMTRLEAIEKDVEHQAEDLLEDLPEKVARLFEEQRRRIAELTGELTSVNDKLERAERIMKEETKAKTKAERRFVKLKEKYDVVKQEKKVLSEAMKNTEIIEEEEADKENRETKKKGKRKEKKSMTITVDDQAAIRPGSSSGPVTRRQAQLAAMNAKVQQKGSWLKDPVARTVMAPLQPIHLQFQRLSIRNSAQHDDPKKVISFADKDIEGDTPEKVAPTPEPPKTEKKRKKAKGRKGVAA